jgi:hypothetical protein
MVEFRETNLARLAVEGPGVTREFVGIPAVAGLPAVASVPAVAGDHVLFVTLLLLKVLKFNILDYRTTTIGQVIFSAI